MAGAAPAHLPVILALAATGDSGRQTSTSSMGNMVVVNGPIRNEIGMNSGHRRARTVQLRQLGDRPRVRPALPESPGRLRAGPHLQRPQGNNFSYNCNTFAENEEASPWEPYHVQYGFEPGESAVTVFYVWGNVWPSICAPTGRRS